MDLTPAPAPQRRRPQIIKALRTTAAAAALAGGVFFVTLAGPAQGAFANANWVHFNSHGNRYTGHQASAVHFYSGVRFADGRWAAHFNGTTHHFV